MFWQNAFCLNFILTIQIVHVCGVSVHLLRLHRRCGQISCCHQKHKTIEKENKNRKCSSTATSRSSRHQQCCQFTISKCSTFPYAFSHCCCCCFFYYFAFDGLLSCCISRRQIQLNVDTDWWEKCSHKSFAVKKSIEKNDENSKFLWLEMDCPKSNFHHSNCYRSAMARGQRRWNIMKKTNKNTRFSCKELIL